MYLTFNRSQEDIQDGNEIFGYVIFADGATFNFVSKKFIDSVNEIPKKRNVSYPASFTNYCKNFNFSRYFAVGIHILEFSMKQE